MVARLAARIGKLERLRPPPPPGCNRCRGQFVWCDRELTRVEVNGKSAHACGACGRVLKAPFKMIVGIDPGAL